MSKTPKPDLDEVTWLIACNLLTTPPKPHKKMKTGKAKGASTKYLPKPRSKKRRKK
jgi:hypothetical protein